MNNFKIVLFLLFLTNFLNAQESKTTVLNGKVVANYTDLEGIYILNLKTDFSTSSLKNGYFTINASVGDTLLFSAVQFKGIKIALTKDDFEKTLFLVKMESLIRELDEVRINEYKNINAISLGIISKNVKRYTPAERKLRAAGDFKAIDLIKIIGGGIDVDAIINKISGRTALLKKELIIERKELLLDKLDNLFEDNYYTETLKIPSEYIKGFKYYIVEDEKFVATIKDKNKTMATFILVDLAVKYNEIISKK